MKDKSKIITIFDTTLRDGEQAPGNMMSMTQKIEIASQLERLGVDIIEAGYPYASEKEFSTVSSIAERISCKVSAFARSRKEDIDMAGKALAKSKNGQIEILGSGSDINLKYKRGISREESTEETRKIISYTNKKYPQLEISFGIEDAARGDLEYLKKLSGIVIEHGAKTIVIGDTVGYSLPEYFGKLVSSLKQIFPDDITLSVHCHNDLGFALANSIAAVENGASEVQVTVNGIGERCGNTQLEAFVMALHVHQFIGRTRIKTELLYETSQLVSQVIKRAPSYETPVVGKNTFATESGMHQAGLMANPSVYQIYDPKVVGRKQVFILGSHSGRSGVVYKLQELGLEYDESCVRKILHILKDGAQYQRNLSDDELLKMYRRIKC